MEELIKVSKDIKSTVLHALKKFNGERLVRRWVRIKDKYLIIGGKRFSLDRYKNIIVIGFGKVSGEMARALDKMLGEYISSGLVIVPKEIVNKYVNLERIEVLRGNHPIPTKDNLYAAEKLVELVDSLDEDDLVICLISGGGSALLTYPADRICLDDIAKTTKLIMEAGGDIYELNTVRKHLSQVKGGNLARIIYPARLVALVLSDVVGDDLSTIASGPTFPDPTTYNDALKILDKYGLREKVPESVIDYLNRGVKRLVRETPKPGDPIFKKVSSLIIGNNTSFLYYIHNKLNGLGYKCRVITTYLVGEAREVGKVIASIGKMIFRHGKPFRKPIILLFGGETTVTVTGDGLGGRNQELALSTALELFGEGDYVVCSVASDGVDGNSPAAGALLSNIDIKRMQDMKLDPITFLKNNDSYTLNKLLGTAIITGYTGTNVNDVTILAVL